MAERFKSPISEVARIFGERVRAQRTQLGLSQEALADGCGLHWSYVSQVERGARNVTLQTIVRLAVALQIDPGELVKGLQPPAKDS